MQDFFSTQPIGEPFRLFGPPHLVAVGIVLLVNGALLWAGDRFPDRWRRPFRFGLAGLMLVNEALYHWWTWRGGWWSIETMLPLHLCTVMILAGIVMLVTRSRSLYEYVYFLGIGGAAQLLITPDAGSFGFPHFRFFQPIVSHGSVIVAAVYMTAVEGCRPTPRSIVRVVAGGNLYLLVVAGINALIGSNYLFTAYKPVGPSLLDYLGPYPWYILSMELIGLVIIGLLALPFAREWIARSSHNGGVERK